MAAPLLSHHKAPSEPFVPHELSKVSLPDYVIEPPDVLVINAAKLVPRPPYRLEPLDTVIIQAKGALPNEPLSGEYVIEPEGRVNLGRSYGTVSITGLTADEAKGVIEKQLKEILADPTVYIAPSRTRPLQQIIGEHLVRPDGKVSLGTYGFVSVVGLTALQARQVIENHLSAYLLNPVVSVDVIAYNSKIIYVIYDQGGTGQTVIRLPVTGNDTVLDVIGQVNGLNSVASKRRIWVARPARSPAKMCQILPVDWVGLTMDARTDTNYQLFPGDRVYVQAKPIITATTYLNYALAPIERLFGFTLLGSGVVQNFGPKGTTTTTTP
jgi:polysaccharide export outer membrane protein